MGSMGMKRRRRRMGKGLVGLCGLISISRAELYLKPPF
jgi:hypothetical protein